jgi:hypothetical protein
MQGKTQREVASMFGIDQSTVSRVIQRMERWQAHAKARENGRLDPQERFRAQRWLTYERNERIIASCLRIAEEMEGFTDVSKTTISRPVNKPSQERAILTQHSTIDRHGIASRFLRLAHRINMDQLKLTAQIAKDGDIPLDPLTAKELAAEALQAAADAAELAQARQRSREWAESEVEHRPTSDPVGWAPPTTPPDPSTTPETSPGATAGSSSSAPDTPPSTPYSVPSTLPGTTHHSPTHDSPAPVHNLHTENNTQIAATADQPCTCMREPAAEENSPATCIIECAPTHAGVSLSHQTAPRIAEPLSY